jgi:DNA-binding PadR family transcriptional regulator
MQRIRYWVLEMAARRGASGVSKLDFFKAIRGVSYPLLERTINELEINGLVKVEWTGHNEFIVFATSLGLEAINSVQEEEDSPVSA